MSNDSTAKWNIEERLRLADALARIEERLADQKSEITELLQIAKGNNSDINDLKVRAERIAGKVAAHEKIAGAVITTGGIVAGIWKYLAG